MAKLTFMGAGFAPATAQQKRAQALSLPVDGALASLIIPINPTPGNENDQDSTWQPPTL